MSGFLLHVGATVLCPHAGQVSIQSGNTRVKVGGQTVAIASDTFTISGCPFQVPAGPTTKPQPCVTLRWVVPASRVRVSGQPVVLQTSSGICQSAEQIPQGPPNVVTTQTRVRGT
jgi:uncharacterized Zn-binding protein involved in type VI secretion